MTSQQAITEVYNSKAFNECIGKMNPPHLRADLKSEVILVLCERKDAAEMHERGELLFFAFKTVCNMIKSNRSTFARNYRTLCDEWSEGETSSYKRDISIENIEIENIADIPMNGRVMKEQKEEPVYEILMQLKPLATSPYFSWVESLKPIMKPYDQNIVSLYMKHGSFRLIEEATGIAWESCYKTFNKAMKNIKEHVDVE